MTSVGESCNEQGSRERFDLPAPLRAFHDFWFIEIDPFIFGPYRLCLGLFYLAFFVMLAPSWLEYYAMDGIAYYDDPSVLQTYVFGDYGIWPFYGLCVLAAICLVLGVFTQVAVVWMWISVVILMSQNPMVANGEEQVLAVLLFFSVWLPLDSSFTWRQLVDPDKRRQMFVRDAKVPVWSLKALQVHFVLIYLLSFPLKLNTGEAWIDGTAVYYSIMALNYPRFPGMEIFAWYDAIVSKFLTYGTLFIEGVFPLVVWFRRLRVVSVLWMMALHFGLAVFFEGIMMFNGAMLVGLVLFLPSRRTREFLLHRDFKRWMALTSRT